MRRLVWLGLFALGCSSAPSTHVLMQFERSKAFYTAPFPSDDLRQSDGSIDLSHFPNPDQIDLIDQALVMLARDKMGFPVSAGIFLPLDGPLDASKLPDVNGSVARDSPIQLMGVDPASPDYMRSYPIQIAFQPDGGNLGAPNLLSVLPIQGIPLRENTRYAVVVTRKVLDAGGQPLGVSPEMAQLAAGTRPASLTLAAYQSYSAAIQGLAQFGIRPNDLAGLAVFTTGSPTAQFDVLRADILTRALPQPDSKPVQTDLFPDFCVYTSAIKMPDYQEREGSPTFMPKGGGWRFDASGKPILQTMSDSGLVISIPRKPMPQNGYPLVVFVRAGGGTNRPLVDRGPMATNGGPPIDPGTGPALHFAKVGFAGAMVDGPLEGLRNTTNDNEDFLIFNVQNAEALRDNIRESALETVFFAHIMQNLSIDVSDCPGATSPARFDASHFGLMGHSMGAWIAPLALAYEPLYKVSILSGAGGSYIENIMYKTMPTNVKAFAQAVIGDTLTENDAALSFLQWAAEPSDPQVYDRRIIAEPILGAAPRHVLMEQGIVDHYILPQIANATSLALGLDEGGATLDKTTPELATQTPLSALLPLIDRSVIAMPAQGNLDGKTTAIVIQHMGDGIEDGHEVVFQTDPPKHQYRCFLQSWLSGVPKVPTDDVADAPCP